MKVRRVLRTLFCTLVIAVAAMIVFSGKAELKNIDRLSSSVGIKARLSDRSDADLPGLVAITHKVVPGNKRMQGQTPSAPVQAPSGEKTVEQTHKNIKALVGLPDSQLIPVMNFFNASLGVNCGFCHVGEGGRFEFDKDDKPEKLAARKMISMTMGINKDSFGGRHQISCFSCHRGSEHPVGVPPLPLAEAEPQKPGNPVAPPPIDQILAKYVAALGGQAAIEKQTSRVMKGTQSQGNGPGAPIEIYETAPDKFAAIMKIQGGGEFTTVYDGSGGWSQNPRGQGPINGDQLEILRRVANLNAPVKLGELYPKLRVVGTDKIGDHTAYVVASQVSPTLIARMYFDSDSGLLLRAVILFDTMVGRIPQQIDYDDYRDVGGVKVPYIVKQTGIDGRSSFTRTFTDIKVNVPVDPSVFAAPKPKG